MGSGVYFIHSFRKLRYGEFKIGVLHPYEGIIIIIHIYYHCSYE